jgi:hypothetical protein
MHYLLIPTLLFPKFTWISAHYDGLGASIPICVLRIQSEEQRQKDRREFKGLAALEALGTNIP